MRLISRLVALAALLAAPLARAQTQEVNFERLQLDPAARGSLVLGTGEVGPRNTFRLSAAGHWEHLPLQAQGATLGDVFGRKDKGVRLIEDRIAIETGLSYVLLPRFEIYGRLPIIVDQNSDIGAVESSGIGTPSIGARFGIVQQSDGAPVNIALAAEVWPTWGKRELLAKEPALAAQIRGEVGKTFGNVLVGGQIGILDRETVDFGVTRLQSEVQGGVVMALAKGPIRPEVSVRGAQPLGGGAAFGEALAGLRGVIGPIEAFVIGGPGFGNAPGTPQWRGLAGLALKFEPTPAAPAAAPPPPPPPPPPAPPAPVDPCAPGQTHTPDQCPALDDDGDGVLNRDDACPTEKGIPENRGCPAKDTDGDGVPDHLDKCPDKAGPADNGGCPRAEISKETKRIDITEKVLFDTGKSTIKPESDKLLADIAALMKAHPEVTKVSVEGHTDNTGGAQLNQRLSVARAKAVVAALVKDGVEASRLEAKGFGPKNPIAPNDTAEGRDANRRVEFVIKGLEEAK